MKAVEAAPPPSAARMCGLLALDTFRSLRRQQLFLVLGLLGFGLLLGARFFASFDFGGERRAFLLDYGLAANGQVGSLLALVLPALVWWEATSRSLGRPVLAGPVSRTSYYLGVFGGIALTLLLVHLALAAGLMLLVEIWGGGLEPAAWGRLLLALGLGAARALVVAAFVSLLGSMAGSLLFSLLLGAAYLLAAQLYPVAWAYAEHSPGGGAWLVEALLWLVPHFGLFASSSALVLEGGGGSVGWAALYGLLYGGVYLGLGVAIFHRRQW